MDLDSDGQKDVVVASRGGFFIYHNYGSGNFSQAQLIGSEESVATVFDVDGDGDQDLIGSVDNGGGIYLHRNINGVDFGTMEPVVPGNSADHLSHADLDQDMDQDLFAIAENGDLIIAYNADGNGTFGAAQTIAHLDNMTNAQAVDIDSDGWVDMVFSSDLSSEVKVCRNDYGIFMAADQFSDSGHGTVHDLDNDGHADVLTANTAAGMVRWQRNTDGDGVLGTPSLVDMGFTAPELVLTSDLDGDGDQDAVVTSSAMDEVAWYENINGQGQFGPRQSVAFGVQASALAAGDVDGDGDEDLFVASVELNKVVWFTNMANSSGMIMGRVYNDINGDGAFNGNDHGLMNMRVELDGVGSAFTNASGMYWFAVTPGEYTAYMGGQENWNFTAGDEHTVFVPVVGAAQGNDFGLQANGELGQLTPNLYPSGMRCNETVFYWASVTNTGNQVGDVQLVLDADDLIGYVGADEPPTEVNNGQLTWVFESLQPTHTRAVRLVMQLPSSQYTGQILNDHLTARLVQDGSITSVNTMDHRPMLLCSVDPNDKQVLPVGEGPEHLTAMGSDLNYTIRFQNTGNAPAIDVVIVDTLEADVDPSSLQILASSHTQRAFLDPSGVLRFEFDNINLPDSGSDYNASQGYVRFIVKHRTGLAEGTTVHNTAGIYFDLNEPVITNTTLNTLTYGLETGLEESTFSGTSDLLVFPNPAHNLATVRLSEDFVGRINVVLLDGSGRVLREMQRRSGTLVIDRGELPAGLYMVRATDENGLTRIARFEFSN